MGVRYPGAPNDAGDMHPVLEAHRQSQQGKMQSHSAMEVVAKLGDEAGSEQEAVVRRGGTIHSLADAPAYDRLMDLAIIGLLVERGQLRVATFAEDDLTKAVLSPELNHRMERVLATNDEEEYGTIAESTHNVVLTLSVVDASAIMSALQYAGTFPMRRAHNILAPQIEGQIKAAKVVRGIPVDG